MPVLKSPQRKQRNRRAATRDATRGAPAIAPESVTFLTPTVTVTFAQPVVVRGVPQWPLNSGILPTSVSLTDQRVLALTYPTPGTPTGIVVPADDRSVQAFTGARVVAAAYSFPE